jgi:transcription termination/antitermination protein NusG
MNEDIGIPDNDWSINQEIKIIDGPFVGFKGVINFIDLKKKKVRVKINLWGRDTPVELSFLQIKLLDQAHNN